MPSRLLMKPHMGMDVLPELGDRLSFGRSATSWEYSWRVILPWSLWRPASQK